MGTLAMETARPTAPAWLWGTATLGIAWNLFGLVQFAGSFTQTTESLMAAGMTSAQADIYLALPAWITAAFAIGVIGGLLGSVALLLRRRGSRQVFAASLAGYLVLFAGDFHNGVFAAIPAQLAILAVVVVIAFALLWVSLQADRQRLLH